MLQLIASEALNWGLITTPTAPDTKGSRNRHFHCFVNFSNGISRTISWSLTPRSAWRYCWNWESGTLILACIARRTALKKPGPGMTRFSSHYLQDDQVIQSLLFIEHGSPALRWLVIVFSRGESIARAHPTPRWLKKQKCGAQLFLCKFSYFCARLRLSNSTYTVKFRFYTHENTRGSLWNLEVFYKKTSSVTPYFHCFNISL